MRRYASYLALALLAAGCATTGTESAGAPMMEAQPLPSAEMPTPAYAAETPLPHPHHLNVVAYTSNCLDRKREAGMADMHRRSNNTTAVHCTLKNLTNCQVEVQVRTQFFDDARHPLGAPTIWKPVIIAPNSIESYQALGYTQEAANYYIEVMPL